MRCFAPRSIIHVDTALPRPPSPPIKRYEESECSERFEFTSVGRSSRLLGKIHNDFTNVLTLLHVSECIFRLASAKACYRVNWVYETSVIEVYTLLEKAMLSSVILRL